MLGGRSATIDPRADAVRADLADIRLADRVFAPHYAAPLPMTMRVAGPLRETREADSPVLAQLAGGDPFEVLELTRRFAWGIAPNARLVGYVDASALGIGD
ncbi:SH3 domain-containing protein [Sphingomonas japonica]|uniref:SH3 domain-containing protein n=2 Tax=Sphingomonas japonica TaxID=511662 RepID=A0ABX0U1U7_9SPHN|nr:SH3 domain-containing protein [Sphingomonas japonica]NIJ24541.1 hypothetical protein [Sphingomonas japonica]